MLYEYLCPSCNRTREVEHGMQETPEILCTCNPQKSTKCIRLISGCNFILKGDGWAKDNYSKKLPDDK